MKRVKWIAAVWPVSLKELGRLLAARKFSPEASRGFILTRTRNDLVEGKYFEKLITSEIITDPFGAQSTYERVEFRATRFSFSSSYPEVELSDAPRSISSFTSQLLQIMDFKLEWANLNVDVLRWAEQIERLTGSRILITQTQVAGLKVDEFTTLAASLTSTRDVRDALADFTRKRSYKMDRLVTTVQANSRTLRVELRSDGSIRLPEEGGFLLPILREAVPPRDQQTT